MLNNTIARLVVYLYIHRLLFFIWHYTQDEHSGDDKSSNDGVQDNTVQLQRPVSKDTTSTFSARCSVNGTQEDTNGRQRRGERSPSQQMCHDSKIARNTAKSATNKEESNEDESTF